MTPKRPGIAIVYLSLSLAFFLFLLSKPSLAALGGNPFLSLAQLAALWGVTLFAISFMIAGRTRLVEEAFGGLDKAYRVHHKTGVWSFSFLAVHLGGILIGYNAIGAPVAKMLFTSPLFITGEIGLAAMAAIILTIIFAKIKYQHFVLVQKFFAIPYAVGAYHLLTSSSDVSRYAPLRLFIIAVISLGALTWLYREFFYGRLGPHAVYLVKEVKKLSGGVTEITLTPKGAPLKAGAGQFAYFSFRCPRISSEPHPFSFTSPPGDSELSFAAKSLGDYTETLDRAEPGDEVVVYGPYGKFFSELEPGASAVFIAGGIGITPFLSALRKGAPGMNATLFYATRSEADCSFGDELRELAGRPETFRYHFHGSGQRGHLTADIVEKRSGGIAGKKIYLCGPVPMMRALADGFMKKGVPRRDIVFEAFSY